MFSPPLSSCPCFQGCRVQQPGGQVEVHGRHAQHRQGHREGRGDGLWPLQIQNGLRPRRWGEKPRPGRDVLRWETATQLFFPLSPHPSGCTGALAYEFTKAHPELTVTVFDLPAVVELSERFRPKQTDDRVSFVAGVFMLTAISRQRKWCCD